MLKNRVLQSHLCNRMTTFLVFFLLFFFSVAVAFLQSSCTDGARHGQPYNSASPCLSNLALNSVAPSVSLPVCLWYRICTSVPIWYTAKQKKRSAQIFCFVVGTKVARPECIKSTRPTHFAFNFAPLKLRGHRQEFRCFSCP